jgi:adenine C2-methylase RlmN of 23S rRNA A2503 and tRNA A37
MREVFTSRIPWDLYKDFKITSSQQKDVFKALLILNDDSKIETVLMKNVRGSWTICISTQVGCPLKCSFCATGKMGFVRDLNSDEIIDQHRFWQKFLVNEIESSEKITNLVIMGMGEPLLNYLNVREAINIILKYTEIGKNHITLSTIGIISELNNLLKDPLWPGVRIAVSLHSADYRTRKNWYP